MKAGQPAREHYSYKKNGSCALLMAIEPKTGRRVAHLFDRRTKREYAEFMKELAARYPKAEKIRMVQDNLSTHSTASFYERFPAEGAFRLAQRFEFHYTPKSASWLNMIEIEFSAISKQCLNRRIATKDLLDKEVMA
ncbi:MAG: IS630 family transposase, partial [Candidatus Udaeobacter sp.]